MAKDAEIPDDTTLEQALRDSVATLRKAGNEEDLTVRKIRSAAESDLGLPLDFFKDSPRWKQRSKDIIHAAFHDDEPSSQKPVSPVTSPPKPVKPRKTPAAAKSGTKRTSPVATTAKPRKRQKRVVSDQSDHSSVSSESAADSDVGDSPPKPAKKPVRSQTVKSTSKTKEVVTSDESDAEDAQAEQEAVEQENADRDGDEGKAGDVSDSDLSDVIDEPPPAKKKRQTSKASVQPKPKGKAAKPGKPSSAPGKDLSPDEAEIKRLQGWLLKCGIRKLWHRELAPYDAPKEKIKHLKGMLKDAGMDGRYSVEKANAIKEQRELAADLEAVKEGAKKWGHGDGEDDAEDGGEESRPRRRTVQSRFVDFGDSGEDSD